MRSPACSAALAAAACALSLGACANFKAKTPAPVAPPPPPPVAAAPPAAPPPVIVKIPTPVKEDCVPKGLPRAPRYPDTDAALREAGGAADRYQLLAAGRILRERRLAELEKVVEGCR